MIIQAERKQILTEEIRDLYHGVPVSRLSDDIESGHYRGQHAVFHRLGQLAPVSGHFPERFRTQLYLVISTFFPDKHPLVYALAAESHVH